MFLRVIECMTRQHDLRLVLLALMVCLLACGTGLRMMMIADPISGRARAAWLASAGAVGGGGIWATHFIAMLAYTPGIAVGYDLAGAALSLAVAVAGASAATVWAFLTPRRWSALSWGVSFGAVVAAMHYLGMLSLVLAARLAWKPVFVIASVAVGVGFTTLAAHLLYGERSLKAFTLASLSLAAGIFTLHFVAMAGLVVRPDPAIQVPASVLPNQTMAAVVSVLTGMIVLMAFVTSRIEVKAHSKALELLRTVIDVLPHGLAYYDAQDRYVLGNKAFCAEMAAAGVELISEQTPRAVLQMAMAARMASAQADCDAIVAPEGPHIKHHRMTDGRYLRFERYPTCDGGLVGVLHDISLLKRQADDLAMARDAAEAAVRAKEAFLANMSHELRTPMNGVTAVADILAHEALSPRQTELVAIIQSSGATLNRLLSDLLDGARMTAGAMEILAEPFDLEAAVQAVVALHRPAAEAKAVAVDCEYAPSVGRLVFGDPVRVSQILGNLLSNAVKFTEKGWVRVRVARDGEMVAFRVTDTGVGFDEAFQAVIFNRFEQADSSITRCFGGTGLGLSIARDLAQRMGGELSCQSKPGLGSVFLLTLPLRAVEAAQPSPVAETVEAPEPSRILVVDDNLTNQRVLGLMLETAGLQVAFADDGRQAVDLWREGGFDAVLMDIQMPVMDGLTAVRAIREEEARRGLARTPIAMVSANASPEYVRASLAAGADDHVGKPVNAERLFACLAEICVAPAGQEEMAA